MKTHLLPLFFSLAATAAVERFDAPLLVSLSDDRYVVYWDEKEIYMSHKEGRFDIKKEKCNQKTFDASLLYLKSTLKMPKPSLKNPVPLRESSMTPFDIEIKDATRKKFFVALNSVFGKTLTQLPTQLKFFEGQAKKNCRKK